MSRNFLGKISLVAIAFLLVPTSSLWGQNLLEKLEKERLQLVGKVAPSVVAIMVKPSPSENGPSTPTLMSGVVVDGKGHIATFGLPLRRGDSITVINHQAKKFPAQLVAVDQMSRVSVIRCKDAGLPNPTWGDSSKVKAGSFTITVGNPFGLYGTVHCGHVSGLKRMVQIGKYPFPHLIQITSPINPGDAGGLVANSSGEVIGLMATSYKRYASQQQMVMIRQLVKMLAKSGKFDPKGLSGFNPRQMVHPSGISFVIPSNFVRRVAVQLIEKKFVSWGRLGVMVAESGDQVIVQKVSPEGPAAKGGLQTGDVVLKYNQTSIESNYQFRALVLHTSPGTKATITVHRKGKEVQCTPTIGSYSRPKRDK